ncbi:MAG: Holliday junction branch migration protein RuvA [Chloroherpetonaceae bacterium]|nr:Holliday junction branch migration protein RuvA [Chloroherpetonaceae bacterium]
MISSIKGIIEEKSQNEVVINIGALSLQLQISQTTFQSLPEVGETAKLVTYLHVREDALILFGFSGDEERALFKLLLSVSGVGPKMAQTILSGLNPIELRESIISANTHRLTGISGVGKKTAERIILELRDKITKLEIRSSLSVESTGSLSSARNDAFSALLSLGFTKHAAEKSLRLAISENPTASAEVLIRLSLRFAQSEKG